MSDSAQVSATRWWVLLFSIVIVLTALILVIGSGVIHVRGNGMTPGVTPQTAEAHSPTPSGPRTATPTSGGTASLPSSGTDALYLQSATEISRVDLTDGSVIRTPTERLSGYPAFLAGRDWVVWKSIDVGEDTASGAVIRTGLRPDRLPAVFRHPGLMYLADHDHIWWLRDRTPGGDAHLERKAELTTINGRPLGQQIPIPSGTTLLADPAGGILTTNAGGVYRLGPQGARQIARGNLIASGKHHVLVWDCNTRGKCGAFQVARSDGKRIARPAVSRRLDSIYRHNELNLPTSSWNLISPDGGFAVLNAQTDPGGPFRLHIMNLHTGEVDVLPGAVTDTNDNSQYAWTANSRWLIALTDHRVRAYDPEQGTSRDLPGLSTTAEHLAVAGQPGN